MVKTLEELKAENAVEEQKDELDTPTGELDGEEAEADELEEEHDDSGESDDADAEGKTAVEDWMKGDTDDDDDDDDQSSGGAKFNDTDMAKARRKYKAKIAKKDDEVAELRRQVEELKKPRQQAPQQGMISKPNRDDFESDDDYTEAMIDYRFAKQNAENQAKSQAEQERERFRSRQEQVNTAVDKHYERAVDLATKSGITPELYQSADYNVRQMAESIFNANGQNEGAGDAVIDALIANLGEGSEKVMYNLGRNRARLEELKSRFERDPSGLQASIYIGELNAKLGAPTKRTTNAPKPAPRVNGDKNVKPSEKALKKAYDKADKAGDAQARFNARREARKAGIDTRNW